MSTSGQSNPPSKPAPARPGVNRPPATPAEAGQAGMASSQNTGDEYDEDDEDGEGPMPAGNTFLMFNAVPSWLTSMLVHIVALLVAAWLTIEPPDRSEERVITVKKDVEVEEIEEWEEQEFETPDVETDVIAEVVDPQPEVETIAEETDFSPAEDLDEAAIKVDLVDYGDTTAPRNDLMTEIGSYMGTGLSGRGSGARSGLVARGGGNAASEAAVAAALKWLAAHQCNDGSWNFDHRRGGPSQANPGKLTSAPRGATGVALLPFLGAGQTHQEGKYMKTVRGGLIYLVRNMKMSKGGTGTFEEPGGRMYSHGICSIAMCEAYGMTKDRDLLQPAQAALNHISYSQDPVGGGWRYTVKQPGDTSVVGWMLMSLKSGHMSYLDVNKNTVQGAMRFLDAVQSDSGAKYGYTGPGGGHATTAIGLLCRMYLGWKKDHAALQRGVDGLLAKGPSKHDVYYNYYATQVMRHQGDDDPRWKKWNVQMRDYLINTQSKAGAETGSWFFGGGAHGNDKGGRLYHTAMSTMVLEVYYRHLPIYRQQAATDEFEL